MKTNTCLNKVSRDLGVFAAIVCLLLAIPIRTEAQLLATQPVSKEAALSAAKSLFPGQTCDYYWIESSTDSQVSSSKWNFFVDPNPLEGWEHDCYIVNVATYTYAAQVPTATKVLRQMPPSGKLVAMDVTDYYGSHKYDSPRLSGMTSGSGQSVSGNTYAIILSGGYNSNSNNIRYWNDCSFIYQTLRNRYSVPKDNIYLLMSDGNDPGEDLKVSWSEWISSPLDLDFDGHNDLELSATKSNMLSVMNTLSSKVKKGDHVFLYVIDHGGNLRSAPETAYICLWNEQRLYDYELADMITPITDKGVFFSAVLGQCYSGGFIQDLTKAGCVVATACTSTQSSYACRSIPYDEFVYHWTSALNGKTPDGTVVDADSDRDGYISMQEAFEKASALDSRTETPLYISTPISVGEDLALDRFPKLVDLYIMNSLTDTGKEPDVTSARLWDSPSIWVRNSDDDGTRHQDPYYSSDHKSSYIYVTVANRGKDDYTGGSTLKVYWAKAATSTSDAVWYGEDTYGGAKTGGLVGTSVIGPIPSGGSRIVKVKWDLPADLQDISSKNTSHQYTLLASASSSSEDFESGLLGLAFDLRWNNNVARKSTTVLRATSENITVKSHFRNLTSTTQDYTLKLIPRSSAEAQLMINQQVYIDLSSYVYSGWSNGGRVMYGMTNNASTAPTKFIPYRSDAYLSNIRMASGVTGQVAIGAKFPTSATTTSKTYTFDLVQQTASGEIIGGETIVIKSPGISPASLSVVAEENGDGSVMLSVEDENASNAVWLCEDEEIGTGESVTVRIREREQTYKVLVPKDEDMMALGSITITAGLRNLHVSEDGNSLDAVFDTAIDLESLSYVINKASDFGNTTECRSIAIGNDTLRVDIESLTPGMYQITFIQAGVPVGSAKFRKID